jgi:hypothetical protein
VDFDEMRNAYNRASFTDRLRELGWSLNGSDGSVIVLNAASMIDSLERRIADLEAEIRRLERLACA